MKTRTLALFAALIFGAMSAYAADDKAPACPNGKTAPACAGKSADCKKCPDAKADCPKCAAEKPASAKTGICPVSGEKLGSMGNPYAHVYKQEGKPDRTVMLCCKACVKSFEKDPAKYLAKLDDK